VKPEVGLLDLQNPTSEHNFKISLEPKEAAADRYVRLFKDLVLFVLAVGFVLVIVWLCIATMVSPAAQAEEKKWAMSILSAAAGGMIGYLIRK
jgi:hypothetical protein